MSTNEKQAISELRIYPGADADFALYNDDGQTYAYETENSEVTRVSVLVAVPRIVGLLRTYLLARFPNLAAEKELMGHSSITTTMRYVHPTPEHKRLAVSKLEQFNAEQAFRQLPHSESLQNPLQ